MRAWLRRLLAIRDTPEALARGLAVGFFFGVSLAWGLQIALALLGAWLVRGNKVVAAAVTAVSNPLTNLPLYGLCWLVGGALLGRDAAFPDLSAIQGPRDLLALGAPFLATLLVGTTVVGAAGAAVLYLVTGRLLPALRRRRGARPALHPGVTRSSFPRGESVSR